MKMFSIKRILIIFVLGFAAPSFANALSDYSENKLAEVESSGGAAVLAFHSASCGTCKRQKPVLDSLLQEKELSSIIGVRVNFDEYPELRTKYRVSSPSTIVIIKDGSEIARSIGVTNKDDLRNMLLKGIKR